jgi:hypothetical protein
LCHKGECKLEKDKYTFNEAVTLYKQGYIIKSLATGMVFTDYELVKDTVMFKLSEIYGEWVIDEW